MSSPSPTAQAQLAAALAALRARYLATAEGTTAAVRDLGTRMAALEADPTGSPGPDDVAAMVALATGVRREVHRVRGTAGTYGLATVARVCADAEARAQAWVTSPEPDAGRRGAATQSLARALAAAFAADAATVAGDGGVALALDDVGQPATASAGVANGLAASGSAIDGLVTDGPDQATSDLPAVVVVEDDDDLAEMLGYSLEAVGESHVRYADGPTALDALLARSAAAERPIVLLDLDLPGMDGHTVHESLRAARPRGAEVVFMTAHAAEHEQVRAYAAGALDYVIKPVSVRVLMAKLPVWRRAARRA